jgi:hypothetical protein
LARPFSPAVIEKIHPAMRLSVLGTLLNATKDRLEQAEEICEYMLTSYAEEIHDTPGILYLISHYLLCGDLNKVRSLIDRLTEQRQMERLSRTGWLAFISGDYTEARTYFEQNLQLFRKMSRQKKVFFQNELGLIHLLALLPGNDNVLLNQGIEYIEIAQKKDYYLAPLMRAMNPVFQQQLGFTAETESIGTLNAFDDKPLEFFIFNLILFWTDKAKAKSEVTYIAEVRDKAEKNGYIWLAAELSSLLAALDHKKKTNAALAKKLHTFCGTVSCVGIVKKMQRWEKTLNGLLTITGDAKKTGKGGEAEQRLVWLFSHDEKYNHCSVTPRMQKMTKKGAWTKGRPVGLKNLHDNCLTMHGFLIKNLLASAQPPSCRDNL